MLNWSEPLPMGRIRPTDDFKKRLLQRLRDRTWLSGADPTLIDFCHRSELRRSPGHKHFFGHVHFIAREPFLDYRNMTLFRQLDDAVARDSLKNRGQGGGLQDTPTHDEHIFARSFGHISLGIEHDGFIIAVGLHFPFG